MSYPKTQDLAKELKKPRQPSILFDEEQMAKAKFRQEHSKNAILFCLQKVKTYKAAQYVLRYKYMFLYAVLGIGIFGVVIGAICALMGWTLDVLLRRGREYTARLCLVNDTYPPVKHSLLFHQAYQIFFERIFLSIWGVLYLYNAIVMLLSEVDISIIFHMAEPLTSRMALLVPAIDQFTGLLITHHKNDVVERARNILALSWFLVFLALPFWISQLIYLARYFKHWTLDRKTYFKELSSKRMLIYLAWLSTGCYLPFQLFYVGTSFYPRGDGEEIFVVMMGIFIFWASFIYMSLCAMVFANLTYRKFINKGNKS